MFTIYCKTVGGRRCDRYFKDWDHAKAAMIEERDNLIASGWEVTRKDDFFNREKGFYVFEVQGKTPHGEDFVLSLVDGYFED